LEAEAAPQQRWQESGRRLTSTPLIPVVVAVVLGLFRIGDKSFFLDEAYAYALAHLPIRTLLSALWVRELHASPYYLLLHIWQWLGSGEGLLRSLSVLFGAIAVFFLFYVAKRYAVAFPAALILAMFPFFVEFEQEARAYAMLLAGTAVSTLLLQRLIERPSLLRAGLYIPAAALMIYIHPLGALVVVAQAVGLLIFVPRPMKWRLAVVYVPVVVLWIPMLLFAMRRNDAIAWIPPTTLQLIADSGVALFGGAFLLGTVLVMLAIGMRRDQPALWLIVPIVGTLAITYLVQPVLQPKYLIAVLPAAAIILARNRPLAIAVLLAVSLIGVGNWYVNGVKDDWRSAVAWVESEARPGDGIVFEPTYLRAAFGYYGQVGQPLDLAVPWSASNLAGGSPDIPGIMASDRIWLVQGHADYDVMNDSVRSALSGLEVVEERTYTGPGHIRMTLLERSQTP
jgi:mannosyltransferase